MILQPYELSDCCGARIYDETDICSKCKEHCEPQQDEDSETFKDLYTDAAGNAFSDADSGL